MGVDVDVIREPGSYIFDACSGDQEKIITTKVALL